MEDVKVGQELTVEPEPTRGFITEEITTEFRTKLVALMDEYGAKDFVGAVDNVEDTLFQGVVVSHTTSRKYLVSIGRFILNIAQIPGPKIDKFLAEYFEEEAKIFAEKERMEKEQNEAQSEKSN